MTGIAIGVAALLVVLRLLVPFLESSMIYYPRAYSPGHLQDAAALVQQITYRTEDGSQCAFLRFSEEDASTAPQEVWFLFGGNASLALDWLFLIEADHTPGRAWVLVDYPGYGLSEGSPSPKSIARSSEKLFSLLDARWQGRLKTADRDLAAGPRIGVFGHSLGAAAAIAFALRHDVDRIVVVSPFTSISDMARLVVGRPLSAMVTHRFDNVAALERIAARQSPPRIDIIHGDRDEVIPVEMGRRLAETLGEKATYHEIAGGDHNSLIYTYRERLLRLLEESIPAELIP